MVPLNSRYLCIYFNRSFYPRLKCKNWLLILDVALFLLEWRRKNLLATRRHRRSGTATMEDAAGSFDIGGKSSSSSHRKTRYAFSIMLWNRRCCEMDLSLEKSRRGRRLSRKPSCSSLIKSKATFDHGDPNQQFPKRQWGGAASIVLGQWRAIVADKLDMVVEVLGTRLRYGETYYAHICI